MKDLQKGSEKANSLKKWREKRNHLRKKSTEKLASKPGQSSWSKKGEMLPSLEERISSIYFSDIFIMIFSISVFQDSKKPPFLAMPLLLALLKTSFPPVPISLL